MKTTKQIPVKKFELINGVWNDGRAMMLPEDVWNRERDRVNPNVKYELLAKSESKKGDNSAGNAVNTSDLAKKAIDGNENGGVDYSNYTLAELREACKNAEIKFGNLDKEKSLINKLKKYESSTN